MPRLHASELLVSRYRLAGIGAGIERDRAPELFHLGEMRRPVIAIDFFEYGADKLMRADAFIERINQRRDIVFSNPHRMRARLDFGATFLSAELMASFHHAAADPSRIFRSGLRIVRL